MTEDLDKDLQDLMGDMDSFGEDAGDSDAGDIDFSAMEDELGGNAAPDGEADADMDASGDLDMGDMDFGDMDAGDDAGDDAGTEDEFAAEDSAPDEGGGGGMDIGDLAAEMGVDLDSDDDTPAAPAAEAPPAPISTTSSSMSVESANLEYLLDIKLDVTFEVGRAKMVVTDLLTLGQGSVIELHRLVGDELDLLVNGRLIAKGEVVVVNEKFGCKITSIIPPEERVRHMSGW